MRKGFNFADEIRSARKLRNWTQAELADHASIASRTVVAVEKGEKPQKGIVIRLAYALNGDAQKWLKHFQYEATAEEINEIIQDSGHLHFNGEKAPEVFFKDFGVRLKTGKALMCVCYLSAPGAAGNPNLKASLIDCIKRGLSVAMACAYPPVSDPVRSQKPQLSLYHNEIYNRVTALALDLHEKLSPDERKRVAVFVPDFSQTDQRHMYSVPPPTGLSTYRPTLIYDQQGNPNGDTAYELALWLVMQQDLRDRWIPVFPPPSTEVNAVVLSMQILQYWKDYFREIIASFTGQQWDCEALSQSGWRMDFPNTCERVSRSKSV